MKDSIEIKIGSVIHDRISTVRMSDIERQTAINAMRDADAIVDVIMWITRKIEQAAAFLFMKPSVKH